MSERSVRRTYLLVLATLVGFGCVAVYSATAIISHETYGSTMRFAATHCVAVVVGCLLSLGVLAVPSEWLRRSAKNLIIGCGMVLVLVKIFGLQVGGATRWFRLGPLSIQPSEFAQLALVLYMADYLARKQDEIRDFRQGLLPPLLVTAGLAGLVLIQSDLGTAIVMTSVTGVMLLLAKARLKHMGILAGIGLIGLAVLIASEGYRMRRMMAFMNPWQDPAGVGFQILQSYLAFANGGLMGQGLGASMQKLFYLPGAHTDFIFAVIAEELGLLGTTAVLGLFALLISCGIRMALYAQAAFEKYLIAGFVSLVGLEAIVNMAVVTGLLPTKGLPLPLLSYGGTAMVGNLMACALILRASRSEPVPGLDAPTVGLAG